MNEKKLNSEWTEKMKFKKKNSKHTHEHRKQLKTDSLSLCLFLVVNECFKYLFEIELN